MKVHGGSTTFFTQDKDGWVKLPGTSDTYCSAINVNDINKVHVSGFYNTTHQFTKADEQNGRLDVNAYDWRIEFLGHAPGEIHQFRVDPEGIQLVASRLDCNNRRTGTPSVRISPLRGAEFYKEDLLPTQLYPGNKRFRSPACNGASADLCERTAQIKVFPSSDPKHPQAPTYTLNCPDGACTVFVGELQGVSLSPTIRPGEVRSTTK